jgi:iron complex outermembrane receptor protein
MDKVNYRKILNSFAIIAAITCLLASPLSFAQNQSGQGNSANDQPVLEEITVTARKRVENLQEVALSVSAMGKQEIETAFATDIRDLIYISPNTLLDDTHQGPGGVAAAYIRGIGVSEVEKNFDPAVGVVVDGIFRGTMTGSIERAIDLERVEVLRGPQGTLFGRNTIGGVFNMERSKPTGEAGGKFRASYGSYDTSVIDGIFNFGLGDSLAVKLSGAYRKQGEGFFKNLNTGRKDGQSEYSSAGINVLWSPTENLEIEWTYQIERTDQDTPPLLYAGQSGQLFCDAFYICAPSVTTPISGDRYKVVTAYGDEATHIFGEPFDPPGYDEPHGFNQATYDADTNQIEVRWDVNDSYHVDYIVGSWETEETVVTDWDAVTEVLFHTDRPADYKQTSHELRLTYDAGGNLAYTVGGYYWDSEYEVRLRSYIGFVVPIPGFMLDLPQTTNQTNKSKALFFEGDYSFSDSWTLTLGGRWTEDKKTTDQDSLGHPFTYDASAKADWSEFTPKAALKYDFSDGSMIYGLFSAGYRSGGFNGRIDSVETAVAPYDPETVDNYELGYRSEWANRTVIFNATIFYMDYADKQEEIQLASESSGTGQVTRVFNAANATIKGAEFELMWLVSEGFTLRANLGLLDAKYDDFVVNTGTAEDPVFTDFSHLDFRRAPKNNFSLVGNYEWQVGGGRMMIQAGWRYLGAHEVDFANKPELHNSAQNLIDGSINYYYNDWYFSLFGRNLADEDGYQIGFDVASLWSYAAPRPPRTYGFEVGIRF